MTTQIRMYDLAAHGMSNIEFDFAFTPSGVVAPVAHACAIRVLRQNWRQGTVGCKARGEVSFSNKKPWKQKGTGRARASSLRSPLWRKGGVTFGPQPRVRELSLNRKQRRAVLRSLLFDRLINNKIICLDGNFGEKPSTKMAATFLDGAELRNTKVLLFVALENLVAYASFRNLPNVTVVSLDQPDAYTLSAAEIIVFLRSETELFKTVVT